MSCAPSSIAQTPRDRKTRHAGGQANRSREFPTLFSRHEKLGTTSASQRATQQTITAGQSTSITPAIRTALICDRPLTFRIERCGDWMTLQGLRQDDHPVPVQYVASRLRWDQQ
jgi:hypothetical protein